MAKLRIRDLEVESIIGHHGWEKENKQTVIINVEIEFDASQAAVTDDISNTIDYETLCKEIVSKAGETNFDLLEKLTAFVLGIVMENHLVQEGKVRIAKPGAIIGAKSVEIEFSHARYAIVGT